MQVPQTEVEIFDYLYWKHEIVQIWSTNKQKTAVIFITYFLEDINEKDFWIEVLHLPDDEDVIREAKLLLKNIYNIGVHIGHKRIN